MKYIVQFIPNYTGYRSHLFDSVEEATEYAERMQTELKNEWLLNNSSLNESHYTDDPHTVDVLVYPAQVVLIEETDTSFVGRFDGIDAAFYGETEQECKDFCEQYFDESVGLFPADCHLIFKGE